MSRSLRRVVATALVVASGTAVACRSSGPRQLWRPAKTHESGVVAGASALSFPIQPATHTLPNGLRVVLMADASSNLVSVDVRYEVGYVDEPDGQAGIAHLAEHLAFQIGPARPVLADRLSVAALSHNAYTTWDATHYRAIALADHLHELLNIEAARMSGTCEQIAPAVFERERDVVRSELRQRYGVRSDVDDLLRRVGYGAGHPYARSARAAQVALESLTLARVCAFMAQHYTPGRAVLVVTGRFDAEDALAAATASFAQVRPRRVRARPHVAPAVLSGGTSRHELPVRRATAHVVTAAPVFADREGAFDDTLMRLFESAVGDKLRDLDYVAAFEVTQVGGTRAPLDVASITVTDPERLSDAVAQMYALRDELTKKLHYAYVTAYANRGAHAVVQRFEAIASRGDLLADYQQFGNDVLDIRNHVVWLRDAKVGPTRLRWASYFARESSHVAYVVPASVALADAVVPAADVQYDIADWAVPVDPDEHLRDLALPEQVIKPQVRVFRLDNGLRVVLAPLLDYPLVEMRLVFPVGTRHDDPDRSGIAQLTAALLVPDQQKTYWYDDLEFLREKLAMGGRISTVVSGETTAFRVAGLSNHAAGLLWQLGWLIERGRPTQVMLERYRAELAKAETASTRSASDRARAIAIALFGAGHPYAQERSERERADAARLDDLRAFSAAHYRANGATLVVAGRFDAALIERRIREQFGRWSGAAPSRPASQSIPAAPSHARERHFAQVDDDTSQVWIALAYATASGASDAAREVVTEMLRMRMASLRERLAATYGMQVSYASADGPGLLTISGAIDAERGGQALVAMRSELAGLRAGDGVDETFARARRVVFERALAQTLQADVVATSLTESAGYDVAAHARAVASLRSADVRRIIDRELPERAGVLLVSGPRAVVNATYAAAGIRDATYLP